MASTFFGLNIAYTGIMAANAKINTTANNISNVETKGYSRQEANQIAGDALKLGVSYGMAGTGVETTDITQVRNFFYDVKYWQAQTNLGQYEVKHQYTTQIEDYFATVNRDQIQGFEPIFSEVFSALDAVYRNAGDDSKKTEFLGRAGDLCKYFNTQSTNLERLQLDVNAEIRNRVETINSIAEQISTLNKQINTIEINNNVHANELRDRRALLVDQLSKIVDVEVRETPIYIDEKSDLKSGIYNYEVMIGGGQILVNGYDYHSLECVARDYKLNQSDAEGLYDIQWEGGYTFSLYGGNLGGELKGLIELRDGNNGEYFHGLKGNLSAGTPVGTDKTQYTLEVSFKETDPPTYLTDMNKNKLPENGKITIGNVIYNYTDWEYTPGTGYKFTIVADNTQTQPDTLPTGTAVSVGKKVDHQGIPYYQAQMNEFTRIFARAMNEVEQTAMDNYGNQADVLFTYKNITDGSAMKYADADAPGTTRASYKSSEDDYYKMTAATFQTNREMEVDVNKFGTKSDIYKGSDTQDVLEEMAKIQHDKKKVSFRGCSAQEFLQVITADISLGKKNAMMFEENYTNVSKSISNQRMSVSAVDNDEEALNLVKFKEAYNLSAKVMQVMTEIYNRLILETGV